MSWQSIVRVPILNKGSFCFAGATHTPQFPMEQMKKRVDAYKHIENIVQPIFDKALKETNSNSMTTIKPTFKILWRPNNYRRKVEVLEKDNSTSEKIKSAIPRANINRHTKLISIKNYQGITIQYGKRYLTGIFSQNIINGTKETYLIEANSINDLNERIKQKKEEIEKIIDESLSSFSKKFNINLKDKKPMWDRYEDWIKGESAIDSIPREVIIHDTYFKKVYEEGIEFKQTEKKEEPTVNMKQYLVNRVTEDFAPEIAESIKQLDNRLVPVLKELTNQIKTHLEVQHETLKTQKEMRKTMKSIQSSLIQAPITTKNPPKQKKKYGLSDNDLDKIRDMEL